MKDSKKRGGVEHAARNKRSLGSVERAILLSLKGSALLSVALLAPNALQFLPKRGLDRFFPRQAATTLSRLAQKNLVRFESRNGKRYARLTEEGERRLAFDLDKAARGEAKRAWDGQWRLVVFDIPESRRGVRRRLRDLMRRVGFYRLQDSVWTYPYDCEELLALIKADLRIGKDVLYAVASSIENDRHLRAHFSLPERR